MRQAFLTASWKNLVFINYEANVDVLLPYLPKGTEPDFYNGKCLVSLVGFMFLNTKVRGIGFPFHRNFEEFNLRFYVRRKEGHEYKRGVVFVKEIVPRRMITWVADWLYGEPYYYHRMKHELSETVEGLQVSYSFLANRKWNRIEVLTGKESHPLITGTEEEFITEHYWGYTKTREGNTSEYNVNHPQWKIYPAQNCNVNVDAAFLYGKQWHEYLSAQPVSAFMADGSPVTIFNRNIIK